MILNKIKIKGTIFYFIAHLYLGYVLIPLNLRARRVVVIVWWLGLQLLMQSVHITTNVES